MDWFWAWHEAPIFVFTIYGMKYNHTVRTTGTFGFWAAYLAGGDTVYLANLTLPDSEFLKVFKPEATFLPEGVGINANLSPVQTGAGPWKPGRLLGLVSSGYSQTDMSPEAWQLLEKSGVVPEQVVPMAREILVGQRWKEVGASWSCLNTYNQQNIFSDGWQCPVKLMVAPEATVPT
ncbi:hypothetical protein GHT09_008375 [Marmota monax]|uniref:L-Fucosyltransferase n=1 Tax=Marmota monax TaxID=9995 RepID=A0A834QQG2_MARMO|nr:hypothetical protein GHT09_008375 [Marmota monax]